jgi:hypothetical protein
MLSDKHIKHPHYGCTRMAIMTDEYTPLIRAPCDTEDEDCGAIVLMHFHLKFLLFLYEGESWSLFVRQESEF